MADALTVRPATRDDVRFVWEVNNEASVRAQSINTASIPWETHEKWYLASLADAQRHLLIAEVSGERVGTVRFDVDGTVATISVALAPEFRGRGYGTATIAEGCKAIAEHGVERVIALIRPDNVSSLAAFARAGFEDTATRTTQEGVVLETFTWER